jgi:hypothetical protein
MLNKDTLVKLLATNDKAVARALVVLNEHQTRDEQAQENTKYLNGEGFRPCHARMGTSMAQFYLRRGFLTAKQIAYWRQPMACGSMRIGVYWKQLALAAELKAKAAVIAAHQQIVGAEAMQAEREMQAMEAEGDREQTRIDELNKFIARCQMEKAA